MFVTYIKIYKITFKPNFKMENNTLLMHKAIMAHEHINKYKYNTIQYNTKQDSEIHKTQHSCNSMTAFQNKI